MTKEKIIQFIADNSGPGMITWGDFKKLTVLEFLFVCKETKIPPDSETISIYTKLTEKDLSTTIDSLVSEGVVCKKFHPFLEGGPVLELNYSEN